MSQLPVHEHSESPALIQSFSPRSRLDWHRHVAGYIAVVIAGGYCESGGAGRWQLGAGDVMLHMPFSSHADVMASRPTQVINLPLPYELLDSSASLRGQLADVDAVVRLAEHDVVATVAEVLRQLEPGPACEVDEIDELALRLRDDAGFSMSNWSMRKGVRRETVYRQFVAAYGVSPSRYRVENRARRAWHDVVSTQASFSDIADRHGFADQSHLCREVARLTGRSPGSWRQDATFVQDPAQVSY